MRVLAFVGALLLLPATAWADPPARVGRLAAVEGEARVFLEADRGWEPAWVNQTLTGQNSAWTEPGARAEVRIGSVALRLAEATQLDIPRLDDEAVVAHVARGSLALRVRFFEREDSLTVTTFNARVQIRGNGRFRVDADPGASESRLTVFSGEARLDARGGTVQVEAGRSLRIAGPAGEQLSFDNAFETAIDAWASSRDSRYHGSDSSRYLSPRMTGWEDLDTYGEWRTEPELGAIWFPSSVATGWAPYRYGRWTHVRPWGWTWVDDAPWGYAPFHYGRWVLIGNRWAWAPGRYVPRPIWAPALVGWVGGPGWSVSVNTGPVGVLGWYPLSPFERYEPWYATRPGYVNNINAVVIVNRPPRFPVHYRDYAYTVVPRDHFGTFRPVQGVIVNVPPTVVVAQPVRPGNVVLPGWDNARPPRPVGGVSGPVVRPPPPAGVAAPPPTPMPVKPVAPAVGSRPVMPEPAPPVPIVKPAPPPPPVMAPPVPVVKPAPAMPSSAPPPQMPTVKPAPASPPASIPQLPVAKPPPPGAIAPAPPAPAPRPKPSPPPRPMPEESGNRG